jgi:hypothetical protein
MSSMLFNLEVDGCPGIENSINHTIPDPFSEVGGYVVGFHASGPGLVAHTNDLNELVGPPESEKVKRVSQCGSCTERLHGNCFPQVILIACGEYTVILPRNTQLDPGLPAFSN